MAASTVAVAVCESLVEVNDRPIVRVGYCYLTLFAQEHREAVARLLGAWPTLADVMSVAVGKFRSMCELADVYVSALPSGHLHVLKGASSDGLSMLEIVAEFRKCDRLWEAAARLRVGGPDDPYWEMYGLADPEDTQAVLGPVVLTQVSSSASMPLEQLGLSPRVSVARDSNRVGDAPLDPDTPQWA